MSMGASPYITTLFLFPHFFPVLYLVEKKYFHGNVRTYKIGGTPSAYCSRVLLLGEIPQNTHRNKNGAVILESSS